MNQKTEKVCPSCGNIIEGDFCTTCGEIIEDDAQTVTLTGEEIAAIAYAWARLHCEINLNHTMPPKQRATMNAYTKTLGILVDRLEKGDG